MEKKRKMFKKKKINIKVAEAQSRYFFAFAVADAMFKSEVCAEAVAQGAFFRTLGYKVRVK